MTGPCLCGDPYCGSCGDPAQAAYVDACLDAEQRLTEELAKAELSPDEYRMIARVGLTAVLQARHILRLERDAAEQVRLEAEAEARMYEEEERVMNVIAEREI